MNSPKGRNTRKWLTVFSNFGGAWAAKKRRKKSNSHINLFEVIFNAIVEKINIPSSSVSFALHTIIADETRSSKKSRKKIQIFHRNIPESFTALIAVHPCSYTFFNPSSVTYSWWLMASSYESGKFVSGVNTYFEGESFSQHEIVLKIISNTFQPMRDLSSNQPQITFSFPQHHFFHPLSPSDFIFGDR